MIGIGELVLLILAFLFAGGAISRLARWAFFRRASGAKQGGWVNRCVNVLGGVPPLVE